MLNQFSNISCYEEFEIQCALTGISKVDVLKNIGHQIDNYYFFVSNDGIFNWFDSVGNHVKDQSILKELKNYYIPKTITKCIIPDSITHIGFEAFYNCKSLKSINITDSVTIIGVRAFAHCKSLKEITIPDSVTRIDNWAFCGCSLLKDVIFKGKNLEEVKQMKYYPWDINDENVFKFS